MTQEDEADQRPSWEWMQANPIEAAWLFHADVTELDLANPAATIARDGFFAGAYLGLDLATRRRDKRTRQEIETAIAEYLRWSKGIPPHPIEYKDISE